MRKLLLLITAITAGTILKAQQVRPANSATIYHELCRLNNLTHVLYVAAHPDDENTRLLAWLVNYRHIRTAYLSLTRGDGGQNILGSEQGPALGLIRTHELMEARKIDGAEQFFTTAVDFGFSKNPEETFTMWNQYALTHDVTYVMRKFRPDVVICRFPPTKEAGHGQHSASAILAAKAFAVTGDKMQYTEDFKYVAPWQPKRLLFNAFRFGDNNTTAENQFKMMIGQYDPFLGMGTGELAGKSRSVHKSQGAGTPSTPGIQKEYFKLVAGDTFTNSIFDGIDTTWGRVGRRDISEEVSKLIAAYDFKHPENSIAGLVNVRKMIVTVKDSFWRKEKLEDIDQLILDCSGLMIEAVTKQPQTVAGSSLPFTLNIIGRGGKTPVTITGVNWLQEDTAMNLTLTNDSLYAFTHTVTIPGNTPVTEPYWLKNAYTGAQYSIPNDTLRGLPETPNTLNAIVRVRVDNAPDFEIPVPLSYKKLDPLKGDVVEQLRIVPDVSVEMNTALVITKPDGSANTSVRLRAFKAVNNGVLTLFGNNKKLVELTGISLAANTDTLIPIHLAAQAGGDYYLDAEYVAEGKKYNRSLTIIRYEHLPTLQYFNMPMSKVIRNDWKVTAKRIGYIEGAGDYTPTLLKLAGLEVDVLKESDMTDALRLKKYDAIITGVRAVNVEKRMASWMPVLLQYVNDGGTLVMQYNTLQDLSTTKMGPYPFTLSNLRVTEEHADVTFTDPNNRLLVHPNKITKADFDYWVQERGLNFPSKWDEHYQTIFMMNDKGEEPLKGSVLYTPYGKGQYVYTSLSLFRQLPAGNKGAIRLLMNFISAGK